jgi:ribosomal protein S18 acetylase RimI-like enzyme
MPEKDATPQLQFDLLGSLHDRAGFSCGVPALDAYLQKQAGQDVRRRVAVAFVATPDGKTIAGYYTLSQYSVELGVLPEELAKKLPQYPLVPATLIGRLAVSVAFRGQGIGELLLMDALYRCLGGSRQVASAAVIVDAKDERAAAFYRKYGFLELPKVEQRLFLPMATIEAFFGRKRTP